MNKGLYFVMNIIVSVLVIVFSTNSVVNAASIIKGANLFLKSDIFVMYTEDDYSLLKKYKVDNISWGNQINTYPDAIEKNKIMFRHNMEAGIKLRSVDIALIQEGGKYIVCGNSWSFVCDKLYWDLRKKNNDISSKLSSKSIEKRAVLDLSGNIVGVPWLINRGMIIPMANTNDPLYKSWLEQKIDGVLKIKPNAIHFDEPAMDSVAIKTKKPFGLNDRSEQEFNLYLENKNKNEWQPDGNLVLDKFDYKKMVLAAGENNKEGTFPLWKEFSDFKVISTASLFTELVAYARKKSDIPLRISANASPNDWKTIPLIQYLDFIASEVGHHASKLEVSSNPLYVYKMAEAQNKPIVSTAFGTDWAVIKKGDHIILACAWISQAYAVGQFMNFPLKAWVPGSTYQPESNVYPKLSSWIKEESNLFDGYKAISSYGLFVSVEALKNHKDREELKNFVEKLIEKGVLFKIILDGGVDSSSVISGADIKGYRSLIILFPEYVSAKKSEQLSRLYSKDNILHLTRSAVRNVAINPALQQVSVLGESNIFIFPRRKKNGVDHDVVLHLLNRDYLPEKRKMAKKSNFQLKIDKSIFNNKKIKSAVIHQAKLTDDENFSNIDLATKLTIKDGGEYLMLTVPSLDLWGIIEFKYF